MKHRILIVDDDVRLLAGMRRNFARKYHLLTAEGPFEGLDILRNDRDITVIVSDQMMPGMTGVNFLLHAREIARDAVRVMLTGCADQQTAIDAIHAGNIFRFMTKPISHDIFCDVIDSAIAQYHVNMNERLLLETTVNSCITLLMDILAMTNAIAFQRAMHLKTLMYRVACKIALPDPWQYELIAMLSQLGSITVPENVLLKHFHGEVLTSAEIEMVHNIPHASGDLMAMVPRLAYLAAAVKNKQSPASRWEGLPASDRNDVRIIGGELLRVVDHFDLCQARGLSAEASLAMLRSMPTNFRADLVEALTDVVAVDQADPVQATVAISDIGDGMLLAENICAHDGRFLFPKGLVVTEVLRRTLINHCLNGDICETVAVTNIL